MSADDVDAACVRAETVIAELRGLAGLARSANGAIRS